MYIYQADVWCNSCAEAIKEELDSQGLTPKDDLFDSDDYPQEACEEATDSPQHCGAHAECLEYEELPSGRRIGALLGNDLTDYGVEYVKEAVAEGGEVADFWQEAFNWIDF